MGSDSPAIPRRDRLWARRLTRLFIRSDAEPEAESSANPGRGSGGITSEGFFLAIASGKGGTGKSFLATNLAVALSGVGERAVLVDCDLGLANDHLLLGANPELSIQHFFAGTASIAEVCIETRYGPTLLPGGSGISRLGDLSEAEWLRFGGGLASLATTADVMILDSAAGISPQCMLALVVCQQVVVVTNPEIAALTDAYALIKCLAGHPGEHAIGVVVNRVGSPAQGRETFAKLAEVSRRFCGCEIHYLGAVPEEPAVSQHRLNQPPLVVSHPECLASQAIFRILARLQQHTAMVPRPVGSGQSVAARIRNQLTGSVG